MGSQDPSHVRLSRGDWNSPSNVRRQMMSDVFRMRKLWLQKLHGNYLPSKGFHWIGCEKMTHLQNIHFAEALPILHLSCSVASGYGGKYGWTPSDPQTFAKTFMWKNVWSPIKASFAWPSQYIPDYPSPTSDRHSPIITGTPTAIAAGQKRWLECALGDFPESRSWATLKGSDGSDSRYKYD